MYNEWWWLVSKNDRKCRDTGADADLMSLSEETGAGWMLIGGQERRV